MPSATLVLFCKSWWSSLPKNEVSNDEVKCYILSRCTVVILCVHMWRNATGVHVSKAPLLDRNWLTAVPLVL